MHLLLGGGKDFILKQKIHLYPRHRVDKQNLQEDLPKLFLEQHLTLLHLLQDHTPNHIRHKCTFSYSSNI